MTESLHVLIAIDNFHPLIGGAEHAAFESGAALVRRGHRVDVLTMRKRPEWPPQEEIAGLRVFRFDERVPPRPFGRLLYERANANAARRYLDDHLSHEPYDLLLLQPIVTAYGALRSRARARAVAAYCFYAPLAEEHRNAVRGLLPPGVRGWRRQALLLSGAWTAHRRALGQRAAIEAADAVVCPSEYSRSLLADAFPGVATQHACIIPLGVDASRFRPADDRQAVRARLGWAPDEHVLLCVRRLVPRMGIGELIRGFGLAAARRPDLRLVIGGVGPLGPLLKDLAKTAGGHVDFVGLLPPDDLPRHLQAADLFLLPSLTLEAFGLVTTEALACGTPVLATPRCAAPEILAPLDPRLLMSGTDPAAIAEALLGPGLDVIHEPGFRDRCRAYAVEHFPWDRTAKGLEELVAHLHTKAGDAG